MNKIIHHRLYSTKPSPNPIIHPTNDTRYLKCPFLPLHSLPPQHAPSFPSLPPSHTSCRLSAAVISPLSHQYDTLATLVNFLPLRHLHPSSPPPLTTSSLSTSPLLPATSPPPSLLIYLLFHYPFFYFFFKHLLRHPALAFLPGPLEPYISAKESRAVSAPNTLPAARIHDHTILRDLRDMVIGGWDLREDGRQEATSVSFVGVSAESRVLAKPRLSRKFPGQEDNRARSSGREWLGAKKMTPRPWFRTGRGPDVMGKLTEERKRRRNVAKWKRRLGDGRGY